MTEKKNFTISLTMEKHRKLKLAATNQDTTMTKIVMDCVDRVIEEWERKNEDR